jgi:hypothetical protein
MAEQFLLMLRHSGNRWNAGFAASTYIKGPIG